MIRRGQTEQGKKGWKEIKLLKKEGEIDIT
jgi:hypothetical protein